MNQAAQPTGASPLVCPFVALAEDRNRRGDGPDQRNRCYAEPAPRQRDLGYQADYCYSRDFASCSVFLAWAARNAAEPAYVTEAAERAWSSGIAVPEDEAGAASEFDEAVAQPTPEGGLFGPADATETGAGVKRGSEQLDWVSASAWADAPWDERAEAEAQELESIAAEGLEEGDHDEREDEPADNEEALIGPRVPAALPMRRRRTRQRPIRTRGSGEWFYADPLDHEPLVKRRYAITPSILLGVVGLLVVALIVFLIPSLLSGGGNQGTAAAPSASPSGSAAPAASRAPLVLATAAATVEPSPAPTAKQRFYRVKAGDSLSGIALRFEVRPGHLQCINGILDKNIVVLGARLQIPPEGYTCPPGWRRGATPVPE